MKKVEQSSNTFTRRNFNKALGSIALLGSLVAIPAYAVEKSDISIGIGPDWGTAGHAVIALKKGYFEEEGLNVELKKFSAGLVQVEALASRDLDFAVPAQAPVFSLRSAGVPILFLSNAAIWGEALSLVVRPESNIKKPSDLIGKKIGVFKGSGAELMYRKILELYDIDPKQVDAVGLKPPEQLSSMIAGLVDGIVVWEPWVQQAVDKANGIKVHTGGTSYFEGYEGKKAVVDWTRTVLVTLEPTVKKYPETVDAVLRAFSRSQDFLTDPANDEEAIALFSEFQGQEPELNRKLKPSFEFSMNLDEGFLDGMNQPLDFLEQIGRIKKRVDVLDYTYTDPLAKARPDAVSIKSNYKP
ncbi:MAG: taurine ABC transporter substrate-binding protein [marine bacterium B5-7]|nr:MAG: taurine ABC transporter substrate-binding protein [marine bacterium B5-7]